MVLAAVLQRGADGDAASQRLTWVIIALVVLAAVLVVATVVFWRATRPDDPLGRRRPRQGAPGDPS